VVQGTQTVTIAGPSASNVAGNQVVIAAAATNGVVSFNTQKSSGVTFRNVNITNSGPAGAKGPAVSLVGANMAFYQVALVSAGTGVYSSSLGSSFLSGCYIEGPDKLFYNYVRVLAGFTGMSARSTDSRAFHVGTRICLQLYYRRDHE
jgi:hypothetical protein